MPPPHPPSQTKNIVIRCLAIVSVAIFGPIFFLSRKILGKHNSGSLLFHMEIVIGVY